MGDPKLLVLRDQVAVIDARVGELIAGLDRGEAGRHWVSLRGLLVEFTKAQSAGKAPEMTVILAQITTAINEGASEATRWAEVSLMALTPYFSATSASRRSRLKSVIIPPGIWGAMA